MKRIAALAGLCVVLLGNLAAPALARSAYVLDGAGLLSSATVNSLDAQIGRFNAATGKEVVVVTVPSLNGATAAAAAEQTFAQQSVNGVLIFIAKAEHADYILPDRAARSIFPPQGTADILAAMNASFKQGDFDGGVANAVNLILDTYRSHPQAQRAAPNAAQQPVAGAAGNPGGFHLGLLWWILIIVGIFWIVRSVVRSAGGFRGGPGMGGPAAGGPGMGGPAAGGPGMGGMYPGYGWGGGGGFWSGLLGGLGGAWLGNELFGQRYNAGNVGAAGALPDPGAQGDPGAYQADPGQADMSGGAGGGWGGGGDLGGGWGGGGDPGGGWGGGDFGGGGDAGSGGGW